YQEIKKVDDSSYNMETDTWTIGDQFLRRLVKVLKGMDKDVKDAVKVLQDVTDHAEYRWEDEKEQIKTVRIFVKENKKSLSIGFDYDPQVLDKIKSLEQRTFNAKNKTW